MNTDPKHCLPESVSLDLPESVSLDLPESVSLDLLDFSQKLGDLSRDVNSFDVKQHVKGYTISSILNL